MNGPAREWKAEEEVKLPNPDWEQLEGPMPEPVLLTVVYFAMVALAGLVLLGQGPFRKRELFLVNRVKRTERYLDDLRERAELWHKVPGPTTQNKQLWIEQQTNPAPPGPPPFDASRIDWSPQP